jgi:hypothetical protein
MFIFSRAAALLCSSHPGPVDPAGTLSALQAAALLCSSHPGPVDPAGTLSALQAAALLCSSHPGLSLLYTLPLKA